MRTTMAVLTCLFLLGACGGVDTDAVKAQIKDLEKQLQTLNAEKVELLEKHTNVKTDSFKATAAHKAAVRRGDESEIAAAKERMDSAAALAQQALDSEKAIEDRITAVEDKIRALKKKLR